jgi:hypothetical protein
LLCALATASFAQSTIGGDAPLIDQLIASATRYTDRLQDFFCIENVVRYTTSTRKTEKWKKLEHQELEVTYTNKRPHYRLMSVDGKFDKLERRVKEGYLLPGGEFGALAWVFDLKANPEFTLDHRETNVLGRAICVFAYRIPLERTNITFHVDSARVRLGHRGLIHADCDSSEVLRVQIATDPGVTYRNNRPLPVGMKLDVVYETTRIGDSEFLLPRTAELTGLFNTTLTRGDIGFTRYRKYETNSTVTFDTRPE